VATPKKRVIKTEVRKEVPSPKILKIKFTPDDEIIFLNCCDFISIWDWVQNKKVTLS
jgi:hypothetical protein